MFSYRKRLEISGSNLIVRLGDGRGEPFSCVNGICTGSTDTVLTLAQDASGYTLIHRDKSIERYDNAGKLLSEISPAGLTSTYSYEDYTGTLLTVTGPFGHSLSFSYNTTGHISTVTNSAGQIIRYNYTNNNLTRVDYPDGTAKLYHYENTSFPNHLTGISYVDSTGATTRYATYAYNATGKAIRTEHAQTDNGSAQERFTLNYDSTTQTTVTDAVGTQEVMTFNTNLGVKNLVSKVNQCDGKSVQQVFDVNNNLTCKKDEENRVTTYTYNATNQTTGMTEGLTGNCTNPAPVPGVTRTTTYEYHLAHPRPAPLHPSPERGCGPDIRDRNGLRRHRSSESANPDRSAGFYPIRYCRFPCRHPRLQRLRPGKLHQWPAHGRERCHHTGILRMHQRRSLRTAEESDQCPRSRHHLRSVRSPMAGFYR